MKKLLFFVGVLLCISSYSQSVLHVFEDWSTTLGSQNFFHKNVIKTDVSNNVYIGGATLNALGDYDILVAKYNSSGVLQWVNQIAGANDDNDAAIDLVVDGSGNVFITGEIVDDTTGFSDIVTIKYNSSGTQQWLSTWDGAANGSDAGASLILDASGNVYVGGGTMNSGGNTDMVGIKYNGSGTQQFATTYNGAPNLNDAVLKCTLNATQVLLGGPSQQDTITYKQLAVRLNITTGAFVSATLGPSGSTLMDQVNDVMKDASGNFYIVGGVPTLTDGYDINVIKLSSGMALTWQSTYNGADDLDDIANGVKVDASGNVYITGYTTDSTEQKNMITIKYNSSGAQQWVETYNDTLNGNDAGNDIDIDGSGNIYVTGYDSTVLNGTDYYTVKYSSSGTEIWNIRDDGDAHGIDKATNVVKDASGNIIVTGESQKFDGSLEYKTVKYVEHDIIIPTDFHGENISSSALYYENRGQLINIDTNYIPQVRYYTYSTYPGYYVMDDTLSMMFTRVDTVVANNDTLQRIDVTFPGAQSPKVFPLEQREEYMNYFLAHCPNPVTEVFGNQKLVIPELWANIDLIYASNQNGFKCYFIVKPGGDPADIQMDYSGASSISLNSGTQELIIRTDFDSIVFDQPFYYQIDNGNDTIANSDGFADWDNLGGNAYGIDTSSLSYSLSDVLIIEIDKGNAPFVSAVSVNENMEWSTFFGTSLYDLTTDVVANPANNYVWMTGVAQSPTFLAQAGLTTQPYIGAQDAFVAKFNSLARNQWIAFWGGSADDYGSAIVIDKVENVYVVGTTNSTDLPNLSSSGINDAALSGPSDGFFLNLNIAGNAVLCDSYIGGGGTDRAAGIALREFGAFRDTYIVGVASSGTGFPVLTTGTYYQSASAGGRDGFVMKLDASNSNQWCTLFGGSAEDFFTDVVLRPSNHNPVIVGGTRTTTISSSLCTAPSGGGLPFCDNGGLFYSQSYGGGGDDDIIVEFDNSSQQLIWSTFFGGGGEELIDIDLGQRSPAVAISSIGDVYLAGHTDDSLSFPAFNSVNGGAYNQPFNGGSTYGNAFIARFDSSRVQTWTSYFGGDGLGNFSHGICIDPANNVFISGLARVSSVQIAADYCTVATAGDYPICNYSGLNYLEDNSTDLRMSLIAFSAKDNLVWSTLFGQGAYTYGLGVSATADKLFLAGRALTSNTLWDFDSGSTLDYYKTTNSTNSDASIARFDISSILVGINEHNKENSSLLIFPNPSSSSITMEFTELLKSNYEVVITDATGRAIERKKFDKTEKSVKFDIQEYSNGLYFILVNSPEIQASGKFIKIK